MSRTFSNVMTGLLILGASAAQASPASGKYVLTITNGGSMPISPGVLYAVTGQASTNEVGQEPTAGLVQLCQTGNPMTKVAELKSDSKVKSLVQTGGPILPGQTISFEITMKNPNIESLHFVAMYGKTKEVCSTIDVQSHTLRTIYPNYDQLRGTDRVISAGQFTEPVVNTDSDDVCANVPNAISCLRALSRERTDKKQIHYFAGYLPSLLNFLEGKYGADETLSLLVPTSGAVSFSLSRK
jgi:hypothetical protein